MTPQTEYETKMMYKVWYTENGRICTMLIETKSMAEQLVAMLKEKNVPCGLNIWRWKTQIEA